MRARRTAGAMTAMCQLSCSSRTSWRATNSIGRQQLSPRLRQAFDGDAGIELLGVAKLQTPAEVRAGGAATGADGADHLPLLQRIAGAHVDAAHVQVHRDEALAVIDEHKAALVMHVGFSKRNDAGGWRADRRAGGNGDVVAEVRRRWRTVQDALIAPAAGDRAAFDRANKAIEEALDVGVALEGRLLQCTFALDAREH